MKDFVKEFNARAEAIGHGLRIDRLEDSAGDAQICSGLMTCDGLPAPHVAVVLRKDGKQLMVLCEMEASKACDGLVVFSTAIDARMGWKTDAEVKKRNDLLKRLHLFDGGLALAKPLQTQSGGWLFTVKKNFPAKGLMSFSMAC